jgi:hypothetical protein|tara:strand:+ start:262 stop:855 length:594 start_codon:yes stop_codon:yes gene_type:complete
MANLRQYIPLITAAQVISKSFTNANTDPYLISTNNLVIAELAHVKDKLGVKFYGELKEENDGGTLTADNQTFLTDYLLDCLAWFTRFEIITEIQMNSSSMGVVSNIDEFSHIVTPDELNVYKQDTYRKAEIFLQDAIEYLNDSDQDGMFPTYEDNKPCSSGVWKNHGIIMYDSIYDYSGNYGCGNGCYDCNCNEYYY